MEWILLMLSVGSNGLKVLSFGSVAAAAVGGVAVAVGSATWRASAGGNFPAVVFCDFFVLVVGFCALRTPLCWPLLILGCWIAEGGLLLGAALKRAERLTAIVICRPRMGKDWSLDMFRWCMFECR